MYRKNPLLTLALISICLLGTLASCKSKTEKVKHSVVSVTQIEQTFKRNAERGIPTYFSSQFTRSTSPEQIKIDVSKVDTLWLETWGGKNGIHYAHSVWGNPQLVGFDGSIQLLKDLSYIDVKTGWGDVLKGKNFAGKPITVGSAKYKNGLLIHANGRIGIVLNKKYKTFESYIGVEKNAGKVGTVHFSVGSQSIFQLYDSFTKTMQEAKMLPPSLFAQILTEAPRSDRLKQVTKQLTKQNPLLEKLVLKPQEDTSSAYWQYFSDLINAQEAVKEFAKLDYTSLEKAINDLSSDFDNYQGANFKQELNQLISDRKALEDAMSPSDIKNISIWVSRFKQLQKEALLANPLLKAYPILFVTHDQYAKDHHNTATLFQNDEVNTASFSPGSSMKIIDFNKGGKVTTYMESSEGVIRDPELNFSGDQIVFSMRKNIEDNYHIYQVDKNGKRLKQLTFEKEVSDIDPLYLPDNQIVFTSTREPKYCMCNIHIMGNLYRMDNDGANITQLGKSSLFEGHSTLLPDGRILYDRWEYVDRNFGDAQGLWTVNPDGTNHAVYFGNNTKSPGGVIDARHIPGTNKVMAILGSCHDRAWGALAIIDREKGIDGKQAVERTWPASARDLIGVGNWDTFMRVPILYEDPYPLSDKYFLCSRTIDNNKKQGLYLVDIFGNETLLHSEEKNCYDPMPLSPRSMPHTLSTKRNYKTETGRFYVQNVYEGTHMKGVKPGSVKYLRIVESIEKKSWTTPAWNGQGVHRPAMNWHSFECKKIWGTVPVEEDGSAYFEVPADRFVYFQLLDKDKMMIQSMRSGTMVQSGETLGCIGCHEDRRMAPPSTHGYTPLALAKKPHTMNGWYGKPRNFGFTNEVQPVLDKKCVSCHDFGKKAGKQLVLAGDRNPFFNAAYMELWMKKKIKAIGAGPAEVQPAYSWGAKQSKMIQALEKGHHGVKLTKEELERIATWIDLNAVYYPDFISTYPNNMVGRSPLNNKQTKRLIELTKVDLNRLAGHNRNKGPQICFERPHLSPCLKNLKKGSKEYNEAVAIIKAGHEQLLKQPRQDMKGFKPSKKDQWRLDKYNRLRQQELDNRAAIMAGKKRYEHPTNE
ncbi:hypothetical protein EMN47_14900 [Prolixibacteraceae bacterium JC049]|nr:hypothetical protein [Prolixibacteraceae bacterium JC049]